MFFDRIKRITAIAAVLAVVVFAGSLFAIQQLNPATNRDHKFIFQEKQISKKPGKIGVRQKLLLKGLPSCICMAYSPDGKAAAVSYGFKTLKVWDLETQKLKAVIKPDVNVFSLSFTPDGKTLAWVDTEVKLWDVQSGKVKGTLSATGHRGRLVFSPDSKTLALSSPSGRVKLWDLATRKTTFLPKTAANPSFRASPEAFSLDGNILAVKLDNNTNRTLGGIRFFDVATGQLRANLQISSKGQNGLAKKQTSADLLLFSPDGKTFAASWMTASRRGRHTSIKLWDSKTGKLKTSLVGHPTVVNCMRFSPDSKTLASGSHDKTIKLWDVDAGTLKATLGGNASSVISLVFTSDGRGLVSASSLQTIKLWEIATRKVKTRVKGHRAYAISGGRNQYNMIFLAKRPDGKSIVSISSDDTIKLWRTSDLKLQARLGEMKYDFLGEPTALAYGPKGMLAWSIGADGSVNLWDITKNEKIRTFNREQARRINQLAISPDGKLLASASPPEIFSPNIVIWDTITGMKVAEFRGQSRHPYSINFSPDGKTLALLMMGSTRGSRGKIIRYGDVRLWDVAKKMRKGTYRGSYFAFSPDNKTFACGETNGITLRNVRSGNIRKTLKATFIRALIFGEDGKTLTYLRVPAAKGASASEIVVRDIANGAIKSTTPINETFRQKPTRTGRPIRRPDVTFSPDGRLMAWAIETPVTEYVSDFKIKLWDVSTGKLLATRKAGRVGGGGGFFGLAFSPDSKMLATSSRHIWVWDISTVSK